MLCTSTLGKSYPEMGPAAQPKGRPDHRLTATAGMLGTILGALREGLATQHRYEHLRSKGAQHDPAIRQAFGISPPASA